MTLERKIENLSERELSSVIANVVTDLSEDLELPATERDETALLTEFLRTAGVDTAHDIDLSATEGELCSAADGRRLLLLLAGSGDGSTRATIERHVENPPRSEIAFVLGGLEIPLVITACILLLRTQFTAKSGGTWTLTVNPRSKVATDKLLSPFLDFCKGVFGSRRKELDQGKPQLSAAPGESSPRELDSK
jgi:hypothetical protein